ncbi:MAG: TIGR01777 family oxidoreductase [Aestuariibaculum sp.]
MKVLITGATGLIGSELVKLCLKQGFVVNYLTTDKKKISKAVNYQGFYWNPQAQEMDINCLKDVDAIFHLVGASISKRWTQSYKVEIINSRKLGTQLLVHSLKGEMHTVKQVISASAIGIYPDSETNYYDESFKTPSTSFLGDVVKKWEHEVDAFKLLGIKVSKIRIGMVFSNKGGALMEMVKPIKYNLGAAFGSGKQWQSWIHIRDLVQMFLYVLENNLEGIYNAIAPNAVSNIELTKTIAKVLDKSLFLPNIPKFLMNLLLGEMHVLLFESQRVSSKKIEDCGFYFKHHHLQPALEDLLR